MTSTLKTLLASVLASLATVAAAQSPVEDEARRQAGTARFVIPTATQCAVFEARATLMAPQYMKDSRGRISAARNEYGHEFAFEYLGEGTAPVAIIAYGQRIALDRKVVVDPGAVEKLRARAILYTQVKKACGVDPRRAVSPLWDEWEDNCNRGNRGGSVECSGNDFGAWFEAPFWVDEWMPSYLTAVAPVIPVDPVCLQRCQTFCADVTQSTGIACAGWALYASTIFTPIGAGLVGIACASGAFIGGIWCRDQTCPGKC